MWITRVSFNKSMLDFSDHLQSVNKKLAELAEKTGLPLAKYLDEYPLDHTKRIREWTTVELASEYLDFLKNRFDDNTDGIVFDGSLEKSNWVDEFDMSPLVENPIKLKTYQSTPKQI